MAYIGNTPAEAFSSFQKQDFTTSATTSYTLDHPVANGNEIALFINFVRQEPTAAYTASGTSLTLTSATTSSDDMYCIYLGKAVQTVNPPNSSVGNSQLDVSAINSQTAETSIAGGDEVLIYDTSASALRKMTRTNFVSGIGGTNTPAFRAKVNSNQTISNGTNTIITFDTEEFDVGSNYDTSNGKFTPTTSGKYFLYCKLKVQLGTGIVYMEFRKNGSNVHSNYENVGSRASGDYGLQLSTIQSANGSSDYFEVNYYQGSGSSKTLYGGADSSFMGYKIIE
jgi:hypothetical protein